MAHAYSLTNTIMVETFFQFDFPAALAFLILLPLVFWRIKSGKGLPRIRFSNNQLFADVAKTRRESWRFLLPLLRVLALLFLIVGLARPQWGNKTTEILSEGIDIMLSVDTSGSMRALDFKLDGQEANRLDVIKDVIQGFVEKRPYDRLGLIVFGDEAYTQCPLTTDQKTLSDFMEWVQIGIAGDGTAIGNGLALSVKRLKEQTTKSKIIILLTDGRSNAGEITPTMAAEMAAQSQIKVYTIGVGTQGKVPYLQQTPFGPRRVFATLELDEAALKEIAQITGGKYFRATDTEQLEGIYAEIDSLEKSEIRRKEYRDYEELFFPLVVMGLFCLLLEICLGTFVFVRIP